MSRRRGAKLAAGMQLFPFLAVLICTLGAVVTLLYVFARQAEAEAASHVAKMARAAQEAEEAKLEGEALDWRISQLKESRAKTAEQLRTVAAEAQSS